MKKHAEIEIVGLSPLLMNRHKDNSNTEPLPDIYKGTNTGLQRKAWARSYFEKGTFGLPRATLVGCLNMIPEYVRDPDFKKVGTFSELPDAFGPMIGPNTEIISINRTEWDRIDQRATYNPNAASRSPVADRVAMWTIRPQFNHWSLTFTITWDSETMEEQMKKLVTLAGDQCGLLDWRPALTYYVQGAGRRIKKGGPYGRFKIVRWANG